MPLKRDSLAALLERTYARYASLYRPLDKTPRHSLLKVFSAVDAGIYHQLLGDLDFLARQIFPDTAEGGYLREHWSSKVTPFYAIAASGEAVIKGKAGKPVPSGVVFAAASGERYYLENSCKMDANGRALAAVKAEKPGIGGNLAPGEKISIVSSIPAGIDSQAAVCGAGIIGGTDAETDEAYLARVLSHLRNPVRYGKTGDFAAWALDASPEVSAAWEYKDYGPEHALLIEVINGSQFSGVHPVSSLKTVADYIGDIAPPVLFTVQSPEILALNPAVALAGHEDTAANRETAINRMKTYLQRTARPGMEITAGALRETVVDGIAITGATVKLVGSSTGCIAASMLQYPYIGEVAWE